jgi:hypothetical protein
MTRTPDGEHGPGFHSAARANREGYYTKENAAAHRTAAHEVRKGRK